MAEFIGRDEAAARSLLAPVGVRLLRVDDEDLDAAFVEVLGESVHERGRIIAQAPADDAAAATGMGAWHVNAVNEAHTVLDGEGIVEFATVDGPVTVRLEGGDVMLVERAEHRYRPTTAQGWVLRWAGPADGELVATETGRESGRWPQ